MKENRRPEGYQEAPLAYDAVWAVALGKSGIYRYYRRQTPDAALFSGTLCAYHYSYISFTKSEMTLIQLLLVLVRPNA